MRFAQADTIVSGAGHPQAMNQYAYVYNNPVKYTDPSGHWYYDESTGDYHRAWQQVRGGWFALTMLLIRMTRRSYASSNQRATSRKT